MELPKFRVFIGNKMEYSVGVSPEGAFYYAGKMKNDKSCFNHTLYDKDVPIMQFTGVQDRNGKDIYCGDIVNTVSNRYTVYYDGGFKAKPLLYERTVTLPLEHIADICYLLGNVYENPELKEL